MDERMTAAIMAPPLAPGGAAQWFGLLLATYRAQVDSGAADDLAAFAARLRTTAADHFLDPAVPAAFLARVDGMDLVRRICALGADLPLRHDELRRAATAGPLPDDDPPPVDPWDRLLARHGREWAAWDGSELGWTRFRDWFYVVANDFDPESYATAYYRLETLNDAPVAVRIDQLRSWGFPITAQPPAPPEPEPAPSRKLFRRRR
jgi:hypothetical protein